MAERSSRPSEGEAHAPARYPIRRVASSLLGGQVATALVAFAEAGACDRVLGARAASRTFLVAWGTLAPLSLVIGVGVCIAMFILDPNGPTGPRAIAAQVRSEPVLTRSRTAAFAPLLIVGAFVWVLVLAHLGRGLLGRGEAAAVGAELTFAATALFVGILAVVLAAVAPMRRALALGAGKFPKLVDPISTSTVAFVLVALLLTVGIRSGDTGGDGGVLGIFGVLRRSELDLRPVVHLAAVALGAAVGPLLVRRRGSTLETAALAIAMLLPIGLTVPAARALDESPALSRAFEKHAPLGKVSLALLRRFFDRDHDGAASTFGGGDCDDRDPKRSPGALDVPGNGIDEDCSGADTPKTAPRTSEKAPAVKGPRSALSPDLNVVLITIDTLRPDLGFLGYDLPVSPNLDRLAEKSAVFERVYAPASYTGKSLAPFLIGKYPSETLRNGSHFNTYEKGNVFLAERLADANIRTFGAASHWYFLAWSGLTQGFAEFDLSAKPSSGQGDTDTSVTSKELTDAALALLAKKENSSKRFFMWVHYFDPHAQYMQHTGAPSFARPGKTGFIESQRAAYDAEIWFTDKHIGRLLDRISSSPLADKTAIVVTSDHGEAFSEHNMNWHGIELWESIVRVPMLVYVPGATPRRIPARRTLIDLVPTVLDLYGLPQPPAGELSGESMIEDVIGTPSAEPRDVYLDMPPGPFNGVRRALITGKGAGTKILHFGGTQYNVFDLESDPGELKDLSDDATVLQPMIEKLQAMRGRLKEIEVKPALQ